MKENTINRRDFMSDSAKAAAGGLVSYLTLTESNDAEAQYINRHGTPRFRTAGYHHPFSSYHYRPFSGHHRHLSPFDQRRKRIIDQIHLGHGARGFTRLGIRHSINKRDYRGAQTLINLDIAMGHLIRERDYQLWREIEISPREIKIYRDEYESQCRDINPIRIAQTGVASSHYDFDNDGKIDFPDDFPGIGRRFFYPGEKVTGFNHMPLFGIKGLKSRIDLLDPDRKILNSKEITIPYDDLTFHRTFNTTNILENSKPGTFTFSFYLDGHINEQEFEILPEKDLIEKKIILVDSTKVFKHRPYKPGPIDPSPPAP